MYKKTKFDNGLELITHNMPHMQSLSLGIFIKVGGRHEAELDKGMGHYLEHLLFKGTRNYSCRQLKESIEGVGGSLNGFTSEELTCYLVKMPKRYLKLAFDILSDMVINPSLPRIEVSKERTVILEELKMYRDLPQSYVYELLDELLWPDQPLGAPIIGTVKSVSSVTRERLLSFKHKFYTSANMVISAAGPLDYAILEKMIAKAFRDKKKHGLNTFLAAEEGQNKQQVKLLHKETEQTHVALGFHAFRREHPLRHALGLLHIIMGANMSSRLFHEVREKRGLAYEIGTNVKRFHDTGAFIVHAGIDNRKVAGAIRLILKELAKVKYGLVSEDEFKRAKEFYVGQLVLGLEDTMNYMLWIGESLATIGKVQSPQDIIKEVNKISREDIRRVAQCLFREEKLNLALIGPSQADKDNIQKKLYIR